jgi:predicted nuclease of predicted toxin-antitoxin system
VGLRFLVDVGVGKKVEEWLTSHGYDTLFVRQIDSRMEDKDILRLAVSESRMVITMDKDFGELVYHSKKSHSGVLLLRLEEATGDEKVMVVQRIMEDFSRELEGCFCVFENGRLRIRSK